MCFFCMVTELLHTSYTKHCLGSIPKDRPNSCTQKCQRKGPLKIPKDRSTRSRKIAAQLQIPKDRSTRSRKIASELQEAEKKTVSIFTRGQPPPGGLPIKKNLLDRWRACAAAQGPQSASYIGYTSHLQDATMLLHSRRGHNGGRYKDGRETCGPN